MCDSESDVNLHCAEDDGVFKQDFTHSFEAELKDLPDVLAFIQRLQDCIIRQRRIILRFHEKYHEKGSDHYDDEKDIRTKDVCDASTQTYDIDFCQEIEANGCSSASDGRSIVEQVKEIAESAVRQTGFVYEANSGMYYDYNTGYYYSAELGLYYDGNSGSYLTYDEATKTFSFHSSVSNSCSENSLSSVPIKKESETNEELTDEPLIKRLKNDDDNENIEVEEGECSDDNSECGNVEENDGVLKPSECDSKTDITVSAPSFVGDDSLVNLDEIANGWPPCMRVVVQETGLDNLSVGTLFIVTCKGGSLGREGNHSVTIPDITISKHHASFKFSDEKKCYTIVDLGSRNGTFLNGNRLSVALQESPPHNIEHGNVLRVGSTHLLCHIHTGQETCKQCEPGCMAPPKPDKGEVLNENKQVRHRSELRRLRRKFGLEGPGSGVRLTSNNSANYQDRAEARRKTVGSSDDNEKTEVASVFQSIKSDNKGFKMMSKMGWTEGQTLGKDSNSDTAITEPIIVEQRPEKAGLGSLEASLPIQESSPSTKRKSTIWKKTQKRYTDTS